LQRTTRQHDARGFSLAESLAGAAILLVGLLGVFPMISLTTRGNTLDRNRIHAANAARRKLEALRALPYDALGLGQATSTPPYLGYYEVDIEHPGYTVGEDRYLNDAFSLGPGIAAKRQVLIQGIDDPLDGLATADTDGLLVDYKQVTATVEWKEGGQPRRLAQRTIITGLPSEVVAGGGTAGDKKKKGKESSGQGAMGKGVDSGTSIDQAGGE
jgi:type II secretory pathway pseudopilin PulG